MLTVTMATMKQHARYYMSKGIPVWLSGKPACGKSEGWQQIADEDGLDFIDLRLAQMDPVDLRGLPYIEGGRTRTARPDFLPTENKPRKAGQQYRGIILYDELADTSKIMQSATYQLILNHRIGEHVVPDVWYQCAAGNRREDKAAAQAVSSALATRFAWMQLEPDLDALRAYGFKNNWHYYVLGFLKFRPAMIWSMEGSKSETFPCPRQWERVSKVCDAPPEMLINLVQGLVGQGAATEFQGFMRTMNLPDLDDIIKDPLRCEIPAAPSAKYALCGMIALGANIKNFGKLLKYMSRPEFGKDFMTCAVTDAAARESALCETDAYGDFINTNRALRV